MNIENKIKVVESSKSALNAIKEISDALAKIKTAILNEKHITNEWWVVHDKESKLYTTLKDYEEAVREADL